MDLYCSNDKWQWFDASGTWPEEREVKYSNGMSVVPLLPSEVPFAYDEDAWVWLWDRVEGKAVAITRSEACKVEDGLMHVLSAEALFGAEVDGPEEAGYTHLQVLPEHVESGPYPTVAELLDLCPEDEGYSYWEVAPGLYKCEPGLGGFQLSELAAWDVIGDLPAGAEFLPNGITYQACNSVSDMDSFARLCALTAAPVDFMVDPEAGVRDVTAPEVHLRWFGSRPHGSAYLSMGLVTALHEQELAARVRVHVGYELSSVYWLVNQGGNWVTRSASVMDGQVSVDIPDGIGGLYVFASHHDLMGCTTLQPIKEMSVTLEADQVESAEFGYCYKELLQAPAGDLPAELEWSTILDRGLKPMEDLESYSVVRTRESGWHVMKGLGIPVSQVLRALSSARDAGLKFASTGGYRVGLADMVGALSPMSVVIAREVPSLKGLGEKVEAAGGRLAGSATAVLEADDKRKARGLQAVGDNLLSLHVAMNVVSKDAEVQLYQEIRSRITSNAYLCEKFKASKFYPVFRDVGASLSPKTGGGAAECLIGVAFYAGGMVAAGEMIDALQLIS